MRKRAWWLLMWMIFFRKNKSFHPFSTLMPTGGTMIWVTFKSWSLRNKSELLFAHTLAKVQHQSGIGTSANTLV
jgi:hypothetical protein